MVCIKSIPEYERFKVNAAIIAANLEYFNQDLKEGIYIHGGERNISHQTNFQNYLEYLFDFKKMLSYNVSCCNYLLIFVGGNGSP